METSNIEPHPDAPEGKVQTLSSYVAEDFTPGSVILCRNSAPLISMAYALLQRDVPCKILGKDIGASLITLVKKMRARSLEDFTERLRLWEEREVDKAIAEDRSPEGVHDKAACLRIFVESLDEDSRTVDSLIAKIELMFTEDKGMTGLVRHVTLSTVHKAKGGEWKTVFILDPFLMPSRFAKQPWQQVQERNLQYVAVTRSMHTLYYIHSESWRV